MACVCVRVGAWQAANAALSQRVRELQRMYHREEEIVNKNKIRKTRELLQMQAPRVAPLATIR